MPFKPDRMKSLRDIKHLSQEELADHADLSQSAVNKAEKGTAGPTGDVLEGIARGLDCTMDYLYDRGPDYQGASDAAAHMAFDVFARDESTTELDRERCSRALKHRDAPKTAELWRSFAQMVEMAIGTASANPGKLVVLKKSRSRPQSK
jgi:transcriptional regulator with XRE-family HTH domain